MKNTETKHKIHIAQCMPASDTSYQMRILSVIAISFVVLGHINFFARGYIDTTLTEAGTFYGWFPYYSFHLPLFLFITGYYFRDPAAEGATFFPAFGKYLLKKVKNLLLPYYIVNGIFLLVDTVIANWGFTFGKQFSWEAWLIYPWTRPYIITFSTPTWYLIALFIAEVYFVLLRKLLKCIIRKDLTRELVLLLLTLAMGVGASFAAQKASPAAIVYLRSVVMLFFIQVGVLYRRHLEKHDVLPCVPYFAIAFAVQFLLILLSGNDLLSPGLYELLDFGAGGYTYFIGGLTGLMLWLRISRLIALIPRKSGFLEFVGANTKYIMSFHVFGWFLLNAVFDLLRTNKIGNTTFLHTFSSRWYHSFLYYAFTDNPRFIVLYFLAGMSFSLLIAWLISLVKKIPARIKTSRSS